ncbi:trypsin-like peptidase domain-containing protein [Streptomyces sp. V4-01]|uniref:Trypsin-like peptidase domain-containing protein n=1 Tax=Actinacidiphila polyblastidii TaxID=3110430 RepID=A0ABU7P5L4_9ACTN|nr:trypsin-like peptidase domain-containing protein [Streptomyces sp. V4-01]
MAARQDAAGRHRTAADALIRVRDLAGRPRGTGFLADAEGTMVTSHEAVDGLARLVLHGPGDQVCLVEAAAVTALPETGLALVATEGLGLPPLPIAPSGPAHPDRRAVVRLPQPVAGTVVGTTAVTYTATDRFHLLDEVYEIALDGLDLHTVPPQVSGAPLLDAETGAVLAVVASALALHAGHRAGGFALPLRARRTPAALAALLARNAATVPCYGAHLNLAGALRLTGTTTGSAAGPAPWREPVERPEVATALEEFLTAPGEPAPLVLGLVGEPGTGRSTELARLAARRAEAPAPAPTLRLRGADLRPGDGGIKDAVERALRTAARVVTAAGVPGAVGATDPGEPLYASPDALAGLARTAGRPLLVLLDAPEEMPPVLAHALPDWTAATAAWLRTGRTRLVVACRPEFWEQAGALLPPEILHDPASAGPAASAASASRAEDGPGGAGGRELPACLRLGDLTPGQAARARARYGLPAGSVAAADAAHPLTLRLLSQVRAALPQDEDDEQPEDAVAGGGTPAPGDADRGPAPTGPPSRVEIFSAYLDLVCLRIALRLAAASAAQPQARGTAVRRLAARVTGAAHEAARRCLGPGQGELDREAFEELFPWRTGWASAVLTEGLLVPAGAGYRFAHEGLADWLQSLHLDVDAALHALVHRWFAQSSAAAEAPVRLPSRPAARAAAPPCVPPAPPVAPPHFPRSLPVPRHRAGAVVEAMLLTPPGTLAAQLGALVRVLDRHTPPPTRVTPAPPAPAPAAPPADLDADTVPNPRPQRPGAAAPPQTGPSTEPLTGPPTGPPTAGLPGWIGRLPGAAPCDRRPEGRTPGETPTTAAAGAPRPGRAWPAQAVRQAEAVWWAAHLLREVLLRVADAAPLREVLRDLAGSVVVGAVDAGGFHAAGMGGLGGFGPWFWRRVPLPAAERLDLLRVLLPADPPPAPPAGDGRARRGDGPRGADRYLDAVAAMLREDPARALPVVCGWFTDDRPLRTVRPAPGRLTVATATQALLYAHRRPALDDLTEALVAAGHPGADEVLGVLAEDEPSAMCRAVDRWAHDPRPDRHVAAATYGPRAAPFAPTRADRELLRYAALTLLARPGDCTLHGVALGLLVRDPDTRARHLPAALRHFGSAGAAGDACGGLHPAALTQALATDPEPVLAAFAARLRHADEATARVVLAELAGPAQPALARRTAALVEEHLRRRPEHAAAVAHHLDLRLEQGPDARPVLLPLAAALLRDHPAQVRRTLAAVFAAPGSHLSRPLRQELLDSVLATERDPVVLDALLTAAADGARRRHPLLTRDLVHRLGLLMGRTPEGTARFDRRIVELAAAAPTFAGQVREWLADGGSWDALIGPSARRRLDTVA